MTYIPNFFPGSIEMRISPDDYQKMYRASKDWGRVLDQTFYALCKRHPSHRNIGEINAKLCLIGRGFATGMERQVRSTKKQGGSLDRMASHLLKHGTRIDRSINMLRQLHEPLNVNKLQVILAEHGKFCRLISPITYNRRSLASFASKYLHFHAPIVPIYDNW